MKGTVWDYWRSKFFSDIAVLNEEMVASNIEKQIKQWIIFKIHQTFNTFWNHEMEASISLRLVLIFLKAKTKYVSAVSNGKGITWCLRLPLPAQNNALFHTHSHQQRGRQHITSGADGAWGEKNPEMVLIGSNRITFSLSQED